MESKQCKEGEHNFRILDVIYQRVDSGSRNYSFRRMTSYYCTKCLKETYNLLHEESDTRPSWYKDIK